MAKAIVGALALASLPSALAFRNSSPFFLISSADLNLSGSNDQIAQSSSVVAQVTDALKSCPSKSYFIVRQDAVSFADYESTFTTRPGGFLHSGALGIESTLEIPEVVGSVDVDAISQHLQRECGAKVINLNTVAENVYPSENLPNDAAPYVYEYTVSAPTRDRDYDLVASNTRIDFFISRLAAHGSYTLVYTTTPRAQEQVEAAERTYEMEDPFGGAVQMELKRDLSSHRRVDGAQKEGGLFERYQYFTPGLFMGISASIPLVLILIVGIRAISGLEVSYFAFSKEMGPAAQRKQ